MERINVGRVVAGGVAAAIVFALLDFVGMQFMPFDPEAWMAQYNLSMPPAALMVIPYLAMGLLLAWLYAAIRPRFGPGMRTAAIAAVFFWLMLGTAYFGLTAIGLWTWNQYAMMAAWGMVQALAAAAVAGWLYRDASTTAPAAATST